MPSIYTATGLVETSSLGQTLMHEHVAILPHSVRANIPGAWDLEAVIGGCVARVEEVMRRGVRTIVDLTTVDLDRDVALVAEVARRSGCNIVVATGCWWRPPRYFATAPLDWLVESWTREITTGIGDTGIRAGIIKLATHEEGVTPAIEKMLRAGARAHRATGVPISTHTDVFSRRGEDQQRIFAEEGVDLSRVIIGHSGDSTDLDYLRGLLARGSTLGMDRFGIDRITPFEQRVDTVAALCREGYAGQLVLSHDASADSGGFPGTDERAATMPNWRYTHIHDDVLPALRGRGVSQAQIDQMLVATPRRIFEQHGGY